MRAIVAAAVGVLLAGAPTAALGAFPGDNGRIAYTKAYSSGATDIWTVHESGTGEIEVTNDNVSSNPAYSPDGSRIAFSSGGDVYTMNADGSDRTLVLDVATGVIDVEWSPDATRLVAEIPNCDGDPECATDLYVFGVDGSGLMNVTNTLAGETSPSWSPDGTRIAFDSVRAGRSDIYLINPDGTGEMNLTAALLDGAMDPDWSPDGGRIAHAAGIIDADGSGNVPRGFATRQPAWSPDGEEIAFSPSSSLYRMPAESNDFGSATFLDSFARDPDWQPTFGPAPEPPPTGSGYPRPKSATPMRLALVQAHQPCERPEDADGEPQHAPPLAFPSCVPPYTFSVAAVVGTPDANGHPANAIGRVSMSAVLGDPATPADEADISIVVDHSDVRDFHGEFGAQPDYQGELGARFVFRLTDRWNAGGDDASGTVVDFPLRASVPCAETADADIGSHCTLATSVDALLPGLVRESKRSIFEVRSVAVFDGGADHDADTEDGDVPFAVPGVFVP